MTPAATPTETPARDSRPAAVEYPARLVRTLPFRRGTFFDAWTRSPERFSELLPDPFAAGLTRASELPGLPTPSGRPPPA